MGRALIAHPTDMPGIIQDAARSSVKGHSVRLLTCAGFIPGVSIRYHIPSYGWLRCGGMVSVRRDH